MKKKWTYETIYKEALKYNVKTLFVKKSPGAYQAAWKMGILDKVCSHMVQNIHWTKKKIKAEASNFKSEYDFYTKNPRAYGAALRFNILEEVTAHMSKKIITGKNNPNFFWTYEKLQKKALKHNSRIEFYRKDPKAYDAARRNGILDKICQHMKPPINISSQEQNLFDLIKEKYPKTQRLRDTKVKIKNKPHITRLEIDIYIPELRKGIEFDGRYWHSIEGLKRSREHWPEEDLENYHLTKDAWFRSKSIELFHIKEEDWLKDKQSCIDQCFAFLEKGSEFLRNIR
jgi:hypothetical protein